MEYVSFAPLTYIYYNAGRRYRSSKLANLTSAPNTHVRLVATSVLHAHVAAPVLCVVTVGAFQDVLDHRIIKGALFSSVGGPCPWLSLSLSQSSSSPACVASSYVISLLAAPLAMLLLCGRAAIPPFGHILTASLVVTIPFLLGTYHPVSSTSQTPRLAALLLVYGDVCARLVEAEGRLHVGDVLTTLCLELCYVVSSLLLAGSYAASGWLSPRAARTLAIVALPKSVHHGWEWSAQCGGWGMGGLAPVLRAPALALLLAAVAGDTDADTD